MEVGEIAGAFGECMFVVQVACFANLLNKANMDHNTRKSNNQL